MARVAIVFCLLLAVVAAAPKKKKVSKSDGRIVGGSWSDISQVPYQVSLQYKGKHICGGSIISLKFILTAAHCFDEGGKTDFSIRAGSSSHKKGGQVRTVKKIITHPDYNATVTDCDIAVLELDEPLSEDENIFVIDLARFTPVTGEEVLVSGWGGLGEGESASKILWSVILPTVDWKDCQKVYKKYNPITDNMFCAGYKKGGRDSCHGDSGGPAVVNGRQAGIVSWGRGCGRENMPGVYTNVSKFRKWVIKYIE